MISDLDPETPRHAVLREYPGYLHEIKQALVDTLPNSTEQTVLGLVRGWKDGELNFAPPDGRSFYFKLYAGAETDDTVELPGGGTLTIKFEMGANVVYACKRVGNDVLLVSDGLPLTTSINYAYKKLAFGKQDYNFAAYQMIRTDTTSKVDFNNENMDKPSGPCLLTFITGSASMPYIDTFISSLADIRVSSNYDLDPRIIVKPAVGKPGCWEMFFDGSLFYITDYEELGHI